MVAVIHSPIIVITVVNGCFTSITLHIIQPNLYEETEKKQTNITDGTTIHVAVIHKSVVHISTVATVAMRRALNHLKKKLLFMNTLQFTLTQWNSVCICVCTLSELPYTHTIYQEYFARLNVRDFRNLTKFTKFSTSL